MDLSVHLSSPYRVKNELSSIAEEVPVSKAKGGWKVLPFIIGNEACANLAVSSLSANLVVFLTSEFNKEKVTAARIATIWAGINYIAPIIGAVIADSYLGRFLTILLASFIYIVALVIITLISIYIDKIRGTGIDDILLYVFLVLMIVASSGVKSASIAFGAEQFDIKTEEDKKKQQSFFNLYYLAATLSVILGLTTVVYIQSNVSWSWGFGLATVLMVISTVVFLIGIKFYVMVKPEGSALTGYAQVIVASISKRNLDLPSDPTELYDVPFFNGDLKLSSTDHFKFLNKAAIKTKEDYKKEASTHNPWRLCPVQTIEELKSVISVLPIWSAAIFVSVILLGTAYTYMVYQAKIMDRKIGSNFEIPAASFGVFSLLAISIWLPLYEKLVLPFFRRIRNTSQGITLIERIGTGLAISVATMVVSALVEVKRRHSAETISAFWLAPQYTLVGLAEAFYCVGMIEFFYVQFPKSMRSIAVSLFWASMGIGLVLSSVVITVVHNVTGGDAVDAWLPQDLNVGHLEKLYWLYAAFGSLNLFYFHLCRKFVRERKAMEGDQSIEDQEK